MKDIRVIAFDADDTLWMNEPYFRETEEKFCMLLEGYLPQHAIAKELYQTEIKNLNLYGYGIKAFTLSMIETVLNITENTADMVVIEKVIALGREMLEKPVELLDGVQEVLKKLNGTYRLVMATKGDLVDQERKLVKSGLEKHFHHIEIMSEKKKADFEKLLKRLDCKAENFMMIGNSLKSDVLPVLEIGGSAVHVPYHITWQYEEVKHSIDHPDFYIAKSLADISGILGIS